MLKCLAQAGRDWLEAHYQRVNRLNVFPVPDGDTGTNMLLTIRSAYQEVAENSSLHAGQMAKGLAYGAMMGSRGNSGTILSQIWAGFAQALGDQEQFGVPGLAQALEVAAQKAYSGVQKPVEGTILTIIREVAEEAQALQHHSDLVTFWAALVERGWQAVERTPDLLPVLKQANVVDSGGTGLMYILEGMLKAARGEALPSAQADLNLNAEFPSHKEADLLALGDSAYNYDVQFVLRGQALPIESIRSNIEAMGDSGVIIGTEEVLKVHIHVDDPGVPLSYAVRFGRLEEVVVEDMQAQYQALLAKQPPPLTLRILAPEQIGVVAVTAGEGLARVFADLGAGGLVSGGQTNNPSTQEILAAIQQCGTRRVIILPNNKNIVMAAQQAAQQAQGVSAEVLKTTTMPQGIAAMIAYQAQGELGSVAQAMRQASQDVTTIEVTKAVRSVDLDGVTVQEGQWIGLVDGALKAAHQALDSLLEALLSALDVEDYSLLTLYYGQGITQAAAQALADSLGQTYAALEIEIIDGGQAHYPYILGLE
jgi:hypothetical protein